MNKITMKVLVVAVMIAINVCAIPVAAFSLFATPEGTSIFSMDYLLAAAILLAANLVVLQLLIAIKKNKQNLFIGGFIVAVVEIGGFILLYKASLNFIIFIYISLFIVLAVLALLVKSIRYKLN